MVSVTGATGADVVHLVPHTHWDREWYEPFQRFRLRLVHLLDEVLERAEQDREFCFTLDGQMAAVDDYLEVRPENRDRVAALVRRGQLAVGPWQILLDEFLCSGETIVRNLEMGWAGAQALGAVMPVGYLPDMFGHCAQMPQVLRRAGLAHACIWRGVPSSVREHAFRWVAPDGSWVRTEYLPGGYGNGVDLFARPDRLAGAVAGYRSDVAPWFGDDPALAMFGTDHSAPLPTLMGLVRGLAQCRSPVLLAVGTLTDYVTARDPEQQGLREITGELRSHARANVLPGVISVRGQLKRAMARAERMVERYAEPWSALWSDQDHSRFLVMAWRRLVDASCHDSVTGCGVDETAAQVAARIAEAEQLGQAVRDQVLAQMASGIGSESFVVANPTPAHRTALVELDVALPADGGWPCLSLDDGTSLPLQGLSTAPTLLAEEIVRPADVGTLLARIHGRELFGQQLARVVVADGDLTFHVAHAALTDAFDPAVLRRELAAASDRHPGPWTVRIVAEPRGRVLAAVPLPPLGHAYVRGRTSGRGTGSAEAGEPVGVEDERVLDNGSVRVEVEPAGTLSVQVVDGTVLRGVGRLVDGGDRGDTYNWGPPADDLLVDRPDAVRVQVLERGPLRAQLVVERDYSWPNGLEAGYPDRRSSELIAVTVRSVVELRTGESFVRMAVSFRNPAPDHRLRWHVPLPVPAQNSAAEGQFGVTERGMEPEGGCGEHPLPTFPASTFVCAGDVTVILDQVTEYELTGAGAELALTLLRSVGMLSVNVHPLRDEPAGPQLPVPAAQRVGEMVEAGFALLPGRGGWAAAGASAAAEAFRHDAVARVGTAPTGHDRDGGEPPYPDRTGLQVGGEGVVLSSLRRRSGGGMEVRVVAMSEVPTVVRLAGRFSAAVRVDLLGRDLEPLGQGLAGVLAVPLRPWEIATLSLTA